MLLRNQIWKNNHDFLENGEHWSIHISKLLESPREMLQGPKRHEIVKRSIFEFWSRSSQNRWTLVHIFKIFGKIRKRFTKPHNFVNQSSKTTKFRVKNSKIMDVGQFRGPLAQKLIVRPLIYFCFFKNYGGLVIYRRNKSTGRVLKFWEFGGRS